MNCLLAAAAVFVDGIVAGIFVGSAMVEHTAAALPGSAWTAYRHNKERLFGRVMPPLMVAAIVLPAARSLYPPGRFQPWFLAAAGLMIAALAVTLVRHIPLNRTIDRFAVSDPPENWRIIRARWQSGHLLRTMLTIGAFFAAVLGIGNGSGNSPAHVNHSFDHSP
jgi:uncharacterized membrane protein